MTPLTQALSEARAMLADVQTAQTVADLDDLYFTWVGHSPLAENPALTFEELRDTLDDYIVCFCKDCGVNVSDVFPDYDESLDHAARSSDT